MFETENRAGESRAYRNVMLFEKFRYCFSSDLDNEKVSVEQTGPCMMNTIEKHSEWFPARSKKTVLWEVWKLQNFDVKC